MRLIGICIEISAIVIVCICIFLILQKIIFRLGQYFNLPRLIQIVSQPLKLESSEYYTNNKKNEYNKFSVKKMLLFIAISRILIFLFAYLLDSFFYSKGYVDFSTHFRRAWFIQDAEHYATIAQNGYVNTGEDKRFIAFYPMYPLLLRIFSYAFQSYMVSGVVISILCLIIACYVLMKLVSHEFGNSKIANGAIKYILIFPLTFFFSIGYTESLFLMLTVMCFYFLRTKKWLLAGICGMLASLTKNQGMLLIIPMFIEMFFGSNIIHHLKACEYKKVLKSWLRSGLYILLCPLGTGIYILINKLVTGNWFTYITYQKIYWDHKINIFAFNLSEMFDVMYSNQQKNIFIAGTIIPTLVFFFAALLIIILSIRKNPLIYTIYSLAFVIVSYTPSWVISGPRYIMNIFPMFIFLSLLTYERKALRYTFNILSILMLVFLTTTFLFRGTY